MYLRMHGNETHLLLIDCYTNSLCSLLSYQFVAGFPVLKLTHLNLNLNFYLCMNFYTFCGQHHSLFAQWKAQN